MLHSRYLANLLLIQKVAPNGDAWQYEYDGNGMLAKVIKPDQTEVTFRYDALGRRMEKCSDVKTVRFVWDGNTPLHEWEEKEAVSPLVNPSLVTWLFDDGFTPLAKLTKEGNYSIISDHLGTPVEAYDHEGKQVWSIELDLYGRVTSGTGGKEFIPFRYPGQYADGETGLSYNRFRYYSLDEGCYTQSDPIGLAGGNPTLYGYVSDPNTFIDLFGEDPIPPEVLELLKQMTGQYNGQGIYEFKGAKTGLPYVGQSVNIYERIAQHLRSGKLHPNDLGSLNFDKYSGLSAQDLNNAEASKMAQLGGRSNLENVRRPSNTGDISDQDKRNKGSTGSCKG